MSDARSSGPAPRSPAGCRHRCVPSQPSAASRSSSHACARRAPRRHRRSRVPRLRAVVGRVDPRARASRRSSRPCSAPPPTARRTARRRPREVELAEAIAAAVPSVEKVRLVSSGTEAAMTAVRLARGVTGRPKIVKFAGCYHGHARRAPRRGGQRRRDARHPGVGGRHRGRRRRHDRRAVQRRGRGRRVFAELGPQIAAVIVEPVAANMGLVPPAPGSSTQLRAPLHASTARCSSSTR